MSALRGHGKKAAFLVENGFCERELVQAQNALKDQGFDCRIVSSGEALVKSWNELKKSNGSNWGEGYAPNSPLKDGIPGDYDVLVIPGGKRSIEKLKLDNAVKPFVSAFLNTGKPVVAYNGAIDLLMFLDLVSGYSIAAKDQLCDTVRGMGGRCAAPEFVVSKNLITLSRFRDVENKIQNAVVAVLSGKPYVEKVVSSDNIPASYQAA
tara:strand:- start:18408 stop:19031 length:624 start_codon:yes stop_codon:yes gene_type:complete